MLNPRRLLIIIFLLTLTSLFIDLPSSIPFNLHLGPVHFKQTITRPPLNLNLGPLKFSRNLEIKQGLDLQGGTHLTLEADMGSITESDRQTALTSARDVIARRVDLFGVSEPIIQTSQVGDSYRLIVELPGIKNIDQAISLIGKTAQLEFHELTSEAKEASEAAGLNLTDFIPTDLTGKDLRKAQVQFDPQTSEPVIALEFTNEGRQKFADITERNLNFPVGIFLDGLPLMRDGLALTPRVNEAITQGKAVITGQFTIQEAKNLTIQLNAGALPVPIKIIQQRNVGATLGQDSIRRSLRAGLVGLGLVVAFMAFYYGWLGILADIALLIYGLLTLSIYKLIPVTLTLPGLAGFILSVGMAVDSNILIFERMKEEIRTGKPVSAAMELGFGRAWDSIKDANVATLITCFILFNPFNWFFLNTSGMVRGFALTLSIGVVISLFTGIVVTRTLLRILYRRRPV